MANASAAKDDDALDVITTQDGIIADLLQAWRDATERLKAGDDVNVRWERGSAAKLLLQHFALREAAKNALTTALGERGESDLAAGFEGDGAARRQAMDRLDREVRGHQAMTLNNPGVDTAVAELGALFDREQHAEMEELVPAAVAILGPSGSRELPSARKVGVTSTTHPSPEPRWYDRVVPLRALRAFYQHLRGTPTGFTSPAVDEGREHTPGMHP